MTIHKKPARVRCQESLSRFKLYHEPVSAWIQFSVGDQCSAVRLAAGDVSETGRPRGSSGQEEIYCLYSPLIL